MSAPERAPSSGSDAGLSWRGLSQLATTGRGQLLLAALLFGLAEMFVLPILVLGLVVMPYRGGAPVVQAAPQLFWTCVLAALLIPVVCSLIFLARVRQARRASRKGQSQRR